MIRAADTRDTGRRTEQLLAAIHAAQDVRVDLAVADLGWLLERITRLEDALEEACDWLDDDLAHAPDTPVAMADRDLVARWRAALAEEQAFSEGGG